MIRQVIQRISNPEASIESLQERRFWLQCERAYTCRGAINGGHASLEPFATPAAGSLFY